MTSLYFIYYRQNDLELSPFTMLFMAFITFLPAVFLSLILTTIVEIPVFVCKKVFWKTERVTYFEHWFQILIFIALFIDSYILVGLLICIINKQWIPSSFSEKFSLNSTESLNSVLTSIRNTRRNYFKRRKRFKSILLKNLKKNVLSSWLKIWRKTSFSANFVIKYSVKAGNWEAMSQEPIKDW